MDVFDRPSPPLESGKIEVHEEQTWTLQLGSAFDYAQGLGLGLAVQDGAVRGPPRPTRKDERVESGRKGVC